MCGQMFGTSANVSENWKVLVNFSCLVLNRPQILILELVAKPSSVSKTSNGFCVWAGGSTVYQVIAKFD